VSSMTPVFDALPIRWDEQLRVEREDSSERDALAPTTRQFVNEGVVIAVAGGKGILSRLFCFSDGRPHMQTSPAP